MNDNTTHAWVQETQFGPIGVKETGGAIVRVYLPDETIEKGTCRWRSALLAEAFQQLQEYFDGLRTDFNLPLVPEGTPFMRSVWSVLMQIPYGETREYGEIAAQLGKPHAARAIGMAVRRNPIPLFIPCHRVTGANGILAGYRGGVDLKAALLALEHRD